MSDWMTSVSTAIDIAKRLRAINENIKNSEFSNLLADLSLELADVKLKLAGVIEENIKLKEQVRELQSVDGDPCPRCRQRGWHVEDSKPDPQFGDLGGIRRTYVCSLCGLVEEKLIVPEA